ncbi:endonuclease [Caerostris darwini]|uniref:Endonuclease n=1 Tax=Caerostris darwini TaxID=1538125 RepID=A0AAV4X0L3_9ARAC|nr:endonuclease [Caerostris darwini]
MSVSNIFPVLKGFKKQGLKTVAEELGLFVSASITILELKDFIINSAAYKDGAEFVKEILAMAIEERKQKKNLKKKKENKEKSLKKKKKKQREELEKEERKQRERKFELEKKRLDNELELARIRAREIPSDLTEASNSRRKCTIFKGVIRITPLKGATIPRLELLAAVLGLRLANSITNADDNWAVFVKNRIEEIRRYRLPLSWGYILGEENPAHLSSRGCKATHLLKTRWWEGPIWMKNCTDEWPCTTKYSNIDEEDINRERRKTICLLNNAMNTQKTIGTTSIFPVMRKLLGTLSSRRCSTKQQRGDNVPNPSDLRYTSKRKLSLDQMKDIGVPNITRTGRHVKIPEKLTL